MFGRAHSAEAFIFSCPLLVSENSLRKKKSEKVEETKMSPDRPTDSTPGVCLAFTILHSIVRLQKSLTSKQHLTIPPVPFSQNLELPTEGKKMSPQSILYHCQSHIDINFPDSSARAKTMSCACVPPAVRLQNSIRNGSCVFYRCCSLLLFLCELVLFSLKGSRIGLQQQGPQQHEPFSNNFSSFPEKEEFPWFKPQRVQSKRGLPYRSTAAKQIRDIAKTKALLCVFNA